MNDTDISQMIDYYDAQYYMDKYLEHRCRETLSQKQRNIVLFAEIGWYRGEKNIIGYVRKRLKYMGYKPVRKDEVLMHMVIDRLIEMQPKGVKRYEVHQTCS